MDQPCPPTSKPGRRAWHQRITSARRPAAASEHDASPSTQMRANHQIEDSLLYVRIRQERRLQNLRYSTRPESPARSEASPAPEASSPGIVLPGGQQPRLERTWGQLSVRVTSPFFVSHTLPMRRRRLTPGLRYLPSTHLL